MTLKEEAALGFLEEDDAAGDDDLIWVGLIGKRLQPHYLAREEQCKL